MNLFVICKSGYWPRDMTIECS